MNKIIHTVVQNRQIVIPASDDLPDGTPVEVQITNEVEKTCMDESDWDDSAEGIEAWMREVRDLEPIFSTEAEQSEFAEALQAQKEWEKKHFFEHADRLRDMWE